MVILKPGMRVKVSWSHDGLSNQGAINAMVGRVAEVKQCTECGLPTCRVDWPEPGRHTPWMHSSFLTPVLDVIAVGSRVRINPTVVQKLTEILGELSSIVTLELEPVGVVQEISPEPGGRQMARVSWPVDCSHSPLWHSDNLVLA